MADGQLLMPSVRLARKMGISRRTLKKRIDSHEIKAVKIGPRMFIPQNEIDRLMGISSGQISAPKPATPNQVSGDGAEWVQTLPNAAKSPKGRLDDILEGYADFLRRFEAGDPDAVAAVAAVRSPEERADAKEAYAAALRVWREYRE
jgi:excisionase family DNA binding protein